MRSSSTFSITACARLAPMLSLLVALLVAPLAAPWPAAAQAAGSARVAVPADSIHVGDRVTVAVRVVVEAGERVILPDTLPLASDDVENAARVRERVETLEDGRVQVTGVYTVTPWRPGRTELPALDLQIEAATGELRAVTAGLPDLEVLSILPADAEALQPMPPKGVVGPSFAWWPFALLALVLLGLAFLLWRRVKRSPAAVERASAPAVPPRQRALAALDQAREAGLIESGEWKDFYSRVSQALREYLEAVESAWGEDLTTTEVLARVRADAGHPESAALASLLGPADQVKFARRVPDAATAHAEWEAARQWVERFDGPPRPEPVEVAA